MQLLSENKILEKELILLNSKYENQINELKHFNNQLLSENKILKTKLDSRFVN